MLPYEVSMKEKHPYHDDWQGCFCDGYEINSYRVEPVHECYA
jgi:hypothetical protein